jgi:hypothetical protein
MLIVGDWDTSEQEIKITLVPEQAKSKQAEVNLRQHTCW